MDKKNRLPARAGQPQALTFRKDLILPPQSQVTQYEDLVSSRIRQLEAYAAQMGRGFGLPMTPGISLSSIDRPEGGAELVMSLLAPTERVSLERRKGEWGLFYSFEPGIVRVGNAQPYTVPLRDAPLDVRERFLNRSEQFFADYLTRCESRLSSMKSAITAGDRTIELLKNVRLE